MSLVSKFKIYLTIFSVCMLSTSFANSGWIVQAPNATVINPALNADFYARLPATFLDDTVTGQTIKALTVEQQHQAQVWELTNDEEVRYVMLMQNQSGVYYATAHLTPVQVLGINARTNAERNHFAALAAAQTAQRIAKELAFVTAYSRAYSAMMTEYQLPVMRPFINTTALSLKSGDKLVLFVNPVQAVTPIIQQAIQQVSLTNQTQLHIYFMGDHISSSAIQTWANNENIPPLLVKQTIITLNQNTALWQSLKNNYSLPALFLIRNGKTIALTGQGKPL